jgi:hypothetical protein
MMTGAPGCVPLADGEAAGSVGEVRRAVACDKVGDEVCDKVDGEGLSWPEPLLLSPMRRLMPHGGEDTIAGGQIAA